MNTHAAIFFRINNELGFGKSKTNSDRVGSGKLQEWVTEYVCIVTKNDITDAINESKDLLLLA